jgi:hypothetical protein
MLAKSTRG